MSVDTKLVELDLVQFAAKLAERSATPGGGSLAAYMAACGAATASMAFRFSTGPKFASVEAEMLRRAQALDALRARALELVDLDTLAFEGVRAGFKLPATTQAERAAKDQAVQLATKRALEIPLETMEVALRALALAAEGAGEINKNLASDCAAGAWALCGAAEAAWLNVRINAGSIAEKSWVDPRLARGEALRARAGELRETVLSAADRLLG